MLWSAWFPQAGRAQEQGLGQEPLAERWRAFGWQVVELNGHDMAALVAEFRKAPAAGKPRMIIAHTIKGKGTQTAQV